MNTTQSSNNGYQSLGAQFTPFQIRIIELWAEQETISALAEKINRSEHTVQTHLKRMRKKINVSRTFDVYRYMVTNQLINIHNY